MSELKKIKLKQRPDDERRIGKFRVSYALLRQWVTLRPVMSKVVVLRAEALYVSDVIQYTAFSKLFEVCDPAMEPPCYEFILTKIKGKPLKVEAKKSEYQW
jgi:hypothetical protein